MSYRFMRMVVFFDLPTETSKDRREYRRFRKFLINEGFIMVQESVYSKLALNRSITESLKKKLHKNKAKKGLVQMITITEKQYNSMLILTGEKHDTTLDNTERLIIL